MPPLLQAVLWFGGTMTGFAGMAIAARSLHAEMSTFEILFFRSLIGMLVVLPFIIRANFVDIKVQKFHWHLGRAIVQFGAQICWMYGIVHLTLSDLTAIEFSVPIFTALLAVLFLGERMWRHKWVATILGFAGVLIILRPEGSAFNLAGLVMILGSFLYAGSGVLVKFLTRTESPQGIMAAGGPVGGSGTTAKESALGALHAMRADPWWGPEFRYARRTRGGRRAISTTSHPAAAAQSA